MKPTNAIQAQPTIFCPVNTTLDIIGGKWKALIIYHLINGTQRFNSLQRSMRASLNACSHCNCASLRSMA